MLAEIAAVIAPTFICAAIGFAWGRMGKPFNTELVTNLALNLGVPFLIFATLAKLEVSPQAFGAVALAHATTMAIVMAVSIVVLRLAGLPWNCFLPPLVFANNGNMGLPICLFAFGDAGLAFAISVFVVSSIGTFTIGLSIFAGSASPRLIFRNPLIYVIGIALLFMLTHTRPPQWLANTAQIVGGMGIPLMLLSLGVAIARIQVKGIGRSIALAVLRIPLGAAVGLGVAWAFGLDGIARGVIVLQAAMPTAVNNYLFAQRYNRRPEEVAGIVMLSTLLSFVSLPLLLWMVLPGAR
ncbi:MAG: AEC family transporter [Rhodospirillales bacterium]